MIKILTGWSNPGGSTIAHIELCNLLNNNGLDCTLYGPHDWHLNQCKSNKIKNLSIEEKDILILHFINPRNINAKKIILSCHETNLYDLKTKDLRDLDLIHFVSEQQKEWHNVDFPSVIIPNIISNFKVTKTKDKIAGIVGSIDEHKQTHVSIENAVKKGFKHIKLYGLITDNNYFNNIIKPLFIKNTSLEYCGFKDRSEIYSSVSDIFHSSKFETFNLVKYECKKYKINYHSNLDEPDIKILSKKEIFKKWEKIING